MDKAKLKSKFLPIVLLVGGVFLGSKLIDALNPFDYQKQFSVMMQGFSGQYKQDMGVVHRCAPEASTDDKTELYNSRNCMMGSYQSFRSPEALFAVMVFNARAYKAGVIDGVNSKRLYDDISVRMIQALNANRQQVLEYKSQFENRVSSGQFTSTEKRNIHKISGKINAILMKYDTLYQRFTLLHRASI